MIICHEYEKLANFPIIRSVTRHWFVYCIFFLHLFILQAIYIELQDLKMKMLFVELNIRLQE